MSVWVDDGRVLEVILKVMNEHNQNNSQWPTQILQQVREGVEEMREPLTRLHPARSLQDLEDYSDLLAIRMRLASILGDGKKVK